jgi:hypothetical protein
LRAAWDPSLIFVMGGALVTTFIGYQARLRAFRARVRWRIQRAGQPHDRRAFDRRIGGLSASAGASQAFVPGGALPALGTGRWEVFAFTAALIAGIFLAKFTQSIGAPKTPPAS